MIYDLFLFDLDDTLLDFRATERLAFDQTMRAMGCGDSLYTDYQRINDQLWVDFEKGLVTKDHLKDERFRALFAHAKVASDAMAASRLYLEYLTKTVVLIDHAVEICKYLSERGEIGIVTNGIASTQGPRVQASGLKPYISFIAVSEDCGFAKPDVRFMEYSAKLAHKFTKATTVMIGDRLETDIAGAHAFGIDACWYNPSQRARPAGVEPRYEISHLSELHGLF